jgi:hypothetical protein
MTAIVRFLKQAGLDAVFDDRTTEVMGEAFEKARTELHDRGQPDIVYEILATRIIEAAKAGERDPEKLVKRALAAFGRKQR